MLKAYKVRLETNNKQKTALNRCAGVSRYVFNWGLAEWKRLYEAGEKTGGMRLCKQFNAIKRDHCPFVTEVPYAITESAFRNLDTAFVNFFRRVKQGADKAGYPKFKSRQGRKSFQLRGVKLFEEAAYLPKIGTVRLSQKGYIPVGADYGVYATASEQAGEWFLSVLVDDGQPEPALREGATLGMDIGIKSAAVFSDGMVFENPKALYAAEKKLKRLQRELSRRKDKGSKNREKTRRKLAKAHAKVNRIRKHAQHQVSNYAVKDGVIVIENLNVQGMQKNHHLARAVSDVGFYELRRQIEYKAKWNGVEVVTVDRWEPSSKRCSWCGNVKEILSLSERVYKCECCGLVIDRDLNAATNLAALGSGRNSPLVPVELA